MSRLDRNLSRLSRFAGYRAASGSFTLEELEALAGVSGDAATSSDRPTTSGGEPVFARPAGTLRAAPSGAGFRAPPEGERSPKATEGGREGR